MVSSAGLPKNNAGTGWRTSSRGFEASVTIPKTQVLTAQLAISAIAAARRSSPESSHESLWAASALAVSAVDVSRDRISKLTSLRCRLGVFASSSRSLGQEEIRELAEMIIEANDHADLIGSVVSAVVGVTETTPLELLAALYGPITKARDLTKDRAARAALGIYARRIVQDAGDLGPEHARSDDAGGPSAQVRDAEAGVQEGQGRWADWLAPEHLVAWTMLHDARDVFLSGQQLDRLPIGDWEELAYDQLHNIDGERLMSQCLQLRLSFGLVSRKFLDNLADLDHYRPERRPRHAIHRVVSPLFVNVSAGYFALADPYTALGILKARRDEARFKRKEDVTLADSDRATMELARRLRDLPAVAIVERMARLTSHDRNRAWAARARLTAPRRTRKSVASGPKQIGAPGGTVTKSNQGQASCRSA